MGFQAGEDSVSIFPVNPFPRVMWVIPAVTSHCQIQPVFKAVELFLAKCCLLLKQTKPALARVTWLSVIL